MADQRLQPLLHDLVGVVLAPTSALTGPDGQLRPLGVQGVFHADARVLRQAELRIDGREPEAIAHGTDGPHGARFVSLARWLGDPGADPTVRVDRIRRVVPRGLTEEIEVVSTAAAPVRATVTLRLGCDLAPIETVKSGIPVDELNAKIGQADQLVWSAEGITVTVTGEGATADAGATADGTDTGADPAVSLLTWSVELPPRGRTVLRWRLAVDDPRAIVVTPPGEPAWSRPQVEADDRRLVRLLDRSLDDLRALRLAEADTPHEVFLGAGVPWFLTLFGRDSLWAARMLLPLGTDLAAGTLRVLARHQGTRLDPGSGEAPGKIMHELRRHEFVSVGYGLRLPAAYYGTIDATMLWVSLLHDAWRWGLPEEEIVPLLPHLEAALGWLDGYADPDGDGFVEYLDTSGQGLANQGWKDSHDSVRFRDGGLARPPIALVEVQGYAHRAALDGAALLDAFDRPGGERWREYAGALAERFRARFWVDGPLGPHPALALDRDKRPVDALTSNIGHLLGSGLLSPDESTRVADLLADPTLAGGFGLRTMSTKDAGFSPLSYHCGSIWTHDTAIALAGLAEGGHAEQAARLADGLLGAAEAFDYRLPELFGGDDRETLGRPVPYPAACRPQAWSAASAVVLLRAAVGLYPDVPNGRLDLRPLRGAPLGAVRVRRFRVGGDPVDVAVDRDGVATLG
ncbi:glycogen debranching N-terminal domain-containing protein [Micromonospora sp. NPDC049559]|uniref:glycogen debranching N-terminal domain-containing protein n=1 Tax=Micromonospora sp. NPDC049559 TaxID=3155923 RepID=UPI003447BA93